MRISPLFVILILSLSSLSLSAPANFVPLPPPTFSGCITLAQKDALLTDLAKRARRLNLPQNSIACFIKAGNQFKPESKPTDSGEPCYDHDTFAQHMSDATRPCVVELLGLEEQPAVEDKATPYSTPNTKPVDYASEPCLCNSGCHYCCVQSGIGGRDACWDTWCLRGTLDGSNRCS